jgi:NAD(P)-dependent dehydrogenase (short-subunit alcohol dehydrogenase family)
MGALNGRRAIITGGASGIGRATAALFAAEGASVTILDLDSAAGEAVVREVVAAGGTIMFVRGDVSQALDCENAVRETVERFGGLDTLFNNAGIIRRADVL